MVPLNMAKPGQSSSVTKRNRFSATLTYDYQANGRDITAKGVNPEDNSNYFETRAGVVDSVLLFKDFTFPYAFNGVDKCYPMLALKTVIKTADHRADFDPALYIDCILLVSKDDE